MSYMELFKKDSKGKIRVIKFSTDDNILIQESGILDGKMVTNKRVCKAKNTGKSNATTASEQALLEMESKITEKLKGEYFKSIEEAENEIVIMPMLAVFDKRDGEMTRLTYHVYNFPSFKENRGQDFTFYFLV